MVAPVALLAAPKTRPLPGESVELKTKDGWTLAAAYAPAKDNQPTFLLLHGTGGKKEDWGPLDRAMVKEGIGVFALDLRGHGASQNPPPGAEGHWRKFRAGKGNDYNDWNNMVNDVEAAVAYLTSHNVPDTSIAIGGADVGSSIGLRYAAVHSAVPMLFMLSPGMSYREVLTVNAIRLYKNRPILMVAGADDKFSMRETPILFEFAKRVAGEKNVEMITANREHGTKMFRNKGLVARIVDWIEHPVHEKAVVISTNTPLELPANGQAATGNNDDDLLNAPAE